MKTNFVKKLKQLLFLLLALASTIGGYSQMVPPNIGGTKVPGDEPIGIGGTGTKDPGTSQYSSPGSTTPFALLHPDHEPRKERSLLMSETFGTHTLTAANYPLDIGGGKSSDGGVSQMGIGTNFSATMAACSTGRYPDRNFGVYSSPREPLGTFY